MAAPHTFADIINLWPTATALAEDVGVKEVTARAWKARGIPAEYWSDLIAAANRREFTTVTCEVLAGIAASQSRRRKAAHSGAG